MDGTDNITTCHLKIYKGKTLKKTVDINKSKNSNNQTASFDIKTGNFVDGGTYSVSVYASDGTTEIETKALSFYTYTEPKLGSVSVSPESPQNAIIKNNKTNVTFTFNSINNRTFKDDKLEKEFSTWYRLKTGSNGYGGWSDLGNVSSWKRTPSEMRKLIPKTYDGQTCTFQFKRTNNSAKWDSNTKPTVNYMLYYRPRIGLVSDNVSYKRNDISGDNIPKGDIVTYESDLSYIYVSWSYDTTIPDAGYVQGYRIRLYDYNKDWVNTYYSDGKNCQIPTKDIPRINKTYIDITPYFKNDSEDPDDYWYYNKDTIQKMDFVTLVSELNKPSIDYPAQNTTWLNTDFRICFKLPTDPDYDYVLGTYTYENIEVKLNGKIYKLINSKGTSNEAVIADSIYSCLPDNLTYTRGIIVYPNYISGAIINMGANAIQVRVKKRYGTTDTEFRWSKWSDIRTFYISSPTYSVNRYDLILASHYNGAFDLVDNTRNVYGVPWNDKPMRVVKNSTPILASQYSYNTIFRKIVETKNKVNTYGTFDTGRDYIKLDCTNKLPQSFNEKTGEYITALKNEGNEYNGRNYIHFIYDRCYLLK